MQRPVVLAAGLGCAGVIALAAVYHADLQAWYHFERLMRDPAHFARIAGEPEGTPERAACERFLAREEGKLALLRELAAHLKSFSNPGWTDCSLELDSSRSTVIVSSRNGGAWPRPVAMTDIHEVFGKNPGAILAWLPALEGGEYTLPEDPETVYGISNGYEGRIGVYVRSGLTPPPAAPASTPPSPPSTGTSAG